MPDAGCYSLWGQRHQPYESGVSICEVEVCVFQGDGYVTGERIGALSPFTWGVVWDECDLLRSRSSIWVP